MNENDVEDLYDLWVENDVWPSGDFFAAITTLEGLEDAIGEDSMAAFKVSVGESRALFAVVVKAEPVHVDLFASDGEELTPDVGAATLGALVDWAFSNTKAKNVIKFLDRETGPIHDQFQAWGFTTNAAAEPEVLPSLEAEVGAEEAEASDEEPEPETGSREWVGYELAKDAFKGSFAV